NAETSPYLPLVGSASHRATPGYAQSAGNDSAATPTDGQCGLDVRRKRRDVNQRAEPDGTRGRLIHSSSSRSKEGHHSGSSSAPASSSSVSTRNIQTKTPTRTAITAAVSASAAR